MKLRPLLLLSACASLLVATGCRGVVGGSCHKPQAYAGAENLPPLRVPAGLDGPDTSGALEVPDLQEPELPLDPDGPCLDAPPAIVAPPPPTSDIVLPDRPLPRRRDSRQEDSGSADPADPDEEPRRRRRPPSRPR